MALRGIKPKNIEKRLKALIYGYSGAGKTTTAINFPKPYLIDTEKGGENSQYVKILDENGGAIFQTSDFDELVNEIKSLLTEKHDYKTLIIDPLTIVYNDLVEKSAAFLKAQSREKDATGTEFGRHYGEANKKMNHLLSLLLRLDMNVIITSHAKSEYGVNLSVIGTTYDCYKKLDYLFDLVIEVQKRGPKDRVALIKKSRIETFPDGEMFPLSYKEISARYDNSILEREAVAEEIATQEQVDEVKRLIELLKVPEETWQKVLDKGNSQQWEEMPANIIQIYIDFLKNKINGEIKG